MAYCFVESLLFQSGTVPPFPVLAAKCFLSWPCWGRRVLAISLSNNSSPYRPADRLHILHNYAINSAMVPDLRSHGSARDEEADAFDLFNANSDSIYDRKRFKGSKIVTSHVPAEDIDFKPSFRQLATSCAFCPPLKAIPLASFYKLHRLPSIITMATPDIAEIELPRETSNHEMPSQGRLPPNGVHNKLLEQVVRTPGRQPSPQPTHLSVPGVSPHRILQEEGPGYVAPKFEGKELQMEQGKLSISINFFGDYWTGV